MADIDSPTATAATYSVLLDEPTDIDLLSFNAVAETVVEALLDPKLDPIALGLSGSWGSGKTSVLRLIGKLLAQGNDEPKTRIVIETDPWRYDPKLGIKESLIGEILDAMDAALPEDDGPGEKSKTLVKRLARRVDWTKALKLAANSAITVSLPSIDGLMDLVKPKDDEPSTPDPITDMVEFRAEFKELLNSEGLGNIEVFSPVASHH